MGTYDPRVLVAAVRAARKALRDLDEDQLPASLRPVAASAARQLPPPLARALLRDLDRFEWLREKAAAAWEDVADASGDDAASAAFLERRDGWERTIEAAVESLTERDLVGEIKRLTAQVRDLEYRLGVERERVDKARARAAEAERRAKRQSQKISDKVQEARQAERIGRLAAESRAAGLRRAIDQATADLSEADDRVAFLRDELLRARRSTEGQMVTHGPSVWAARDPLDLADLLDQIAAAARPEAVPDRESVVVDAPPLMLPAGVRPDEGAAVEWVLSQQQPFVMIVDGYNLSHQWTEPLSREDVNHRLARVRRMAIAPARLVVVYDSQLTGGGQNGPGPGGIEIRFTDEEMIADTEIIRLSGEIEGNVVVVSSDREVREGCPRALCLWSQAVKEWLSPRS